MIFSSPTARPHIARNVSTFYVVVTLFLALLLNLLPGAYGNVYWRPDFVLLLVLYWSIYLPRMSMMGLAWAMGLFMDLAHGVLLGQHAFAYTLAAYVALLYHRRILFFPAWQQALYIFVLLLGVQTVILTLRLISFGVFPGWGYFMQSLSGALLWPLLTPILQSTLRFRRGGDKFPSSQK